MLNFFRSFLVSSFFFWIFANLLTGMRRILTQRKVYLTLETPQGGGKKHATESILLVELVDESILPQCHAETLCLVFRLWISLNWSFNKSETSMHFFFLPEQSLEVFKTYRGIVVVKSKMWTRIYSRDAIVTNKGLYIYRVHFSSGFTIPQNVKCHVILVVRIASWVRVRSSIYI